MREVVKQLIGETLKAMDISFDEILLDEMGGHVRFTIKSKESGLLIGNRGAHFSALSHVLRKMAAKKIGAGEDGDFKFMIDVNDYSKKLLEELRNKTFLLSERARAFRSDIEMDPMPPYERMLVHTLCENEKNVKTESVGDGYRRRVVIRYRE